MIRRQITQGYNSDRAIEILKQKTFDNRELLEISNYINDLAKHKISTRVLTLNLQILRLAAESLEFHELIKNSELWVVDGWPIELLLSHLGKPSKRRTGADLVGAILAAKNKSNLKMGFIGGDQSLVSRIEQENKYKTNPLICISSKQFELPLKEKDLNYLSQRVIQSEIQILFVGLGSPKQDQIIDHLHILNSTIVFIPCGAALEFAYKIKRRAPKFFQSLRMEWLWRGLSEPIRLGPRYFADLKFFIKLYLIINLRQR